MYNTTHVTLAQKFLANTNVEATWDEAYETFAICVDVNNERIWTDGKRGLWNTTAKGVKVRHANFLVSKYEDDDEDKGYYWSGGLSGTIHYDGSGEDGTWYDGADVEQNTLINKVKDMRESDGMIYTDEAFLRNMFAYMVAHCDFDMQLQQYLDFDYSEQGMQDDEYVNLDVELDADFWMHVLATMKQTTMAA